MLCIVCSYRTYRLTISAGVVTRYQSTALCLHLYVLGHGHSLTHQEITPRRKVNRSMFIVISLTFVVALRVDAIDLYVLSVITKRTQPYRLSLACLPLSAPSLPAPCRCVIPFNTVIMVPICALYIYTIYVSMLGNIDKCACVRERSRFS